MNKLVFIYLLSLIILNIQSVDVDCTSIRPSTGGDQTGGQGGEQTGEESGEKTGEESGEKTGEGEGEGEGKGGEKSGEERRRLDNNPCQGAEQVTGYNCVVDGNKCKLKSLCELEENTNQCETHKELTDKKCVKDGTKCKLVSASTDSSNILNIFKITFILLFIFTIL